MNENLLIVGAGVYGLVAKEIAESMKCFKKIAFVDDMRMMAPNKEEVIGKLKDIERLVREYSNIIVAIGNPQIRLSVLQNLEKEIPCKIATLISPNAYIAPSAKIDKGTIVEPMAVVHTQVKLLKGCIISAGAVINHASVCEEGVHVDCNATVAGGLVVPPCTKVCSGRLYMGK